MSVLVRGMEMPKNCNECRFAYRGACIANIGREVKVDQICPLVEIPDQHGRLIDADAFSEEMRKRHKAASDWYDSVEDNEMLARAESTMMAFTECRLTLDAMQTVIEAEEE